ncbi:MAG: single-stranded DNA-binding protein, partial [Clostridia bacterium]|nr:single-stranded DNA-binding protein [Clostridia bacterium]
NREADFFNITVWRTQAENCSKFLKKGSKVAVVGSLQNHSYEDKDGVKRTLTDIVASEIEFLSTGSRLDEGEPVKKGPITEVEDDNDLPF